MRRFNTNGYEILGTADYERHFTDAMRGRAKSSDLLTRGTDISTGGFILPYSFDEKYVNAVTEKSLFRKMATVINAMGTSSRIYAKDCDDLAEWVAEGGAIPIYDGTDDFTKYSVDLHKLAVFVKLDDDFIHDVSFDIDEYLTDRLAKNFAEAEDNAFINGTGEDEPTGILNETVGAEIGITTDEIGFDDIISLYFSLDKEYRKNAVWLMNDETALTVRTLKDSSGNYLWNPYDGTLLEKQVAISYDMPSVENGAVPIAFGDLSYYWIINRSLISVRPLKEKFVTYDQTGYLAFEFLDGKLIRPEAIKTLKISDSE